RRIARLAPRPVPSNPTPTRVDRDAGTRWLRARPHRRRQRDRRSPRILLPPWITRLRHRGVAPRRIGPRRRLADPRRPQRVRATVARRTDPRTAWPSAGTSLRARTDHWPLLFRRLPATV